MGAGPEEGKAPHTYMTIYCMYIYVCFLVSAAYRNTILYGEHNANKGRVDLAGNVRREANKIAGESHLETLQDAAQSRVASDWRAPASNIYLNTEFVM